MLGGNLNLSPDGKLELLQKLALLKGTSAHTDLIAKQLVVILTEAGLQPDRAEADRAIEFSLKTGSLRRCREQGLPIADWRVEVEKEYARIPEFAKNAGAKD